MKAARLTDGHSCPIPPAPYLGGPGAHVGGPILAPGAPLVLSEGLAASRLADFAACLGAGDVDCVAAGAAMVLINGLPAVRVGDDTAHKGLVVGPGAAQIEIGGPTFSLPPNVKVTGDATFMNKTIRDLYFLSLTPSGRALFARLQATGKPIIIVNGKGDQQIGIPYGPQVVVYNPEDNRSVRGAGNVLISCPAQVSLGHELVHAMNNAEGKLVILGDDPVGTATQPKIGEREAQAIGVGSHSGDYPTENSLRKDLGLPPRDNHFGGVGALPPAGTLRPGAPGDP